MNTLGEYLEGLLGKRLTCVKYGGVGNDSREVEVHDIGSELILTFNNKKFYISWSISHNQSDQYWEVSISSESFCKESIEYTEMTESDLWKKYTGEQLEAITVYGYNNVPQILELEFSIGSILVGIGSGGYFGDDDCIMVRSSQKMYLSEASLIDRFVWNVKCV